MADKPAAAEAAKKVNPQVEALKKNHFWILAGLLLITALVVWWMGTGALADQFKKDAATNTNAFSSLTAYKVAQVNGPPNKLYKTEVNNQNDLLGKQVVETWQKLFDRQETILTFNKRVGANLASLVLLDVNERKDKFALKSNEISFDLENYHNNQIIEQEFEQLFAMLDLRRVRQVAPAAPAAGAAPGAVPAAAPAAGVEGPPIEGIVVWSAPRSTQQLMQRYKTTKTPSPDRFAVTQEDIWIFKGIFGVIQKINQYSNEDWLSVMNGNPLPTEKPRIDQGNVPIKRIEFCDVAQYAMYKAFGDPGRLSPLGTARNDDAIFINSGDSGVFNVGTVGDPAEDKLLLDDRYLDSRNFPVANPAEPPISEFRQVFLQLTVLMDQRIVPVLISECAQAPFPIETRQVRLSLTNVDLPQKKDAGVQLLHAVEPSPHDVSVTLRGVVYIYLKPDQKKLGKGSDKEPGNRDYGIPRRAPAAEGEPTP
jgi:hypothetical protein